MKNERPSDSGEHLLSYNIDQPAGNLWYHDHALGITRLNVYAGLAGFYFVRDDYGHRPAGQSARIFRPLPTRWPTLSRTGCLPRRQLFYPAFPGDPAMMNLSRMKARHCRLNILFQEPHSALIPASEAPRVWPNSSAITWWSMAGYGLRIMWNPVTIGCTC